MRPGAHSAQVSHVPACVQKFGLGIPGASESLCLRSHSTQSLAEQLLLTQREWCCNLPCAATLMIMI